MTISVRLNGKLSRALEVAAESAGVSKSEIVRRSVEQYLSGRRSRAQIAWEEGKSLFGKCRSRQSDVSVNAEKILREAFDAKRAAGRR